ncbi:UNVERIFIED_ORG: ADP-L-glycero-D-manno-heptose 6-epimerase [Rahnella aquatilis]
MILITGAAGFIGSNVLRALNKSGISDIAICDSFGFSEKWKNIIDCEFSEFVFPEDLFQWIVKKPDLKAVIHLGAKSDTTSSNADEILKSNFNYTSQLWEHCVKHSILFIYASSSSTYGDGSCGFNDYDDSESLSKLSPLSLYSWSKHIFDRKICRQNERGLESKTSWYGLKFFNVYGPGETHKGRMQSSINHICQQILAGNEVSLFKSQCDKFADGEQARDYIHITDVCKIILWFLFEIPTSGIYNVGTGNATSFNRVVQIAQNHLDRNVVIKYHSLPPDLINQYQHFTQANLNKLTKSGYSTPLTTIESGISSYIDYIINNSK